MAKKLRAMGITWNPKEMYKGNVVIAAIEQSFQNGIEKGKREAATEYDPIMIDKAYKSGHSDGYQKGFSDGSSDLVELARVLKKILLEVAQNEST